MVSEDCGVPTKPSFVKGVTLHRSRAHTSLDKAYIPDYMGTVKPALERDTPTLRMLILVEKADRPAWCDSQALPGASHPCSWPSVYTYKDSLCSAHYRYHPKRMWAGQSLQTHTSPHCGCAPNPALNPSSRCDLFHGLTTATPTYLLQKNPHITTPASLGAVPRAPKAWFSSSAPTSLVL